MPARALDAMEAEQEEAALPSLVFVIKVRGKRRALWRVKLAADIVKVAARVLGGRVVVEAEVG